MPSVPERLREAREALGLSIYQVADITKIRTDHIRAIEEGQFGAFAAPVYVRGFIRTYARLLRLDPAEIIESLDAELKQDPRLTEASSLAGRRRSFGDLLMLRLSRINWRIAVPTLIVLFAVAVAYAGYQSWKSYQARDPLAGLAPARYVPPSDGDTLPLPGGAVP